MIEPRGFTDEEIDLIAERIGGTRISVRNSRNNGDSGVMRRIAEALIVAAVVAMISVTWSLSNTVSTLTAQVSNLSEEIKLLRARP